MRLSSSLGIVALLLIWSCSGRDQQDTAENAVDAGREFVRGILDGDYVKAESYLLKDSINLDLFRKQQMNDQSLSEEQKRKNRESSIRPLAINAANDSTTLFRYYHSANPGDTTTLRIIRQEGHWLVDLKSILKP